MRRVPLIGLALVLAATVAPAAGASTPRVLRVGTYKGIPGQYKSIQAAVNAARPGDWVLIGPGDYKTTKAHEPAKIHNRPAAVLITKARLHLRGMSRKKVIIDGTKPGSAVCSTKKSAQNFGPKSPDGPLGLNGVMVWKADNVAIQNMTACNFLGGSGHAGNGFWWNGGDDSGKIGGWGYTGTNLTATSTFFENEKSAAQYGIFTSNWDGGHWKWAYASNFNDSGFYIGACRQQCNQIVDHIWAQYNALGYSGTNSGGLLIVKNSRFDHNQDGFDTNTQNADQPSPQNGACPPGKKPPVKGAVGCWVFMHNYVHDNNVHNVPTAGSAAAGPVGTGMSISGGRFDSVIGNTFKNNKAWGTIFVPYLDSGEPCTGGTLTEIPGSCLFNEWGDALLNNKYIHNGGYGNPTNGDFEQLNFGNGPTQQNLPTNCFAGNHNPNGLSPGAKSLEAKYPKCTGKKVPPNVNVPFLNEVLCDSGVQFPPFGCQPGSHYPPLKPPVMRPLPKNLWDMPNPCKGVPSNPWCKRTT